jgi:ligand-binding SRPBCC domain-containing protein
MPRGKMLFMSSPLPPTFTLSIDRVDGGSYQLTASQVLPLPRAEVFRFFEDPRNLFDITPDWLRFVMQDRKGKAATFEGAEFDYSIRWFGIPLRWRSRIEGYLPPERFTDVQLIGPYKSWSHLHLFEERDGGTLMRDIVTYRLPLGPLGGIAHRLAVRRQLENIFRYRARRIDAWCRGCLQRK